MVPNLDHTVQRLCFANFCLGQSAIIATDMSEKLLCNLSPSFIAIQLSLQSYLTNSRDGL